MSILKIHTYPDPVLRQKAKPIQNIDKELLTFIDDMAETMYSANGIGLAAPQVGCLMRLFIADVTTKAEPDKLRIFINPRITRRVGTIKFEEGCLSFPGVNEDVKRAEQVTVTYLDRYGNELVLDANGILSIVIQHEYDHLDGITFVDRMSRLKRMLTLREYNKKQSEKKSA